MEASGGRLEGGEGAARTERESVGGVEREDEEGGEGMKEGGRKAGRECVLSSGSRLALDKFQLCSGVLRQASVSINKTRVGRHREDWGLRGEG